MELKQLTYFCELMREKNITRAAGHLFLTHQALSLSISKLEEELGVPLFLRSQQGVEPTLYAENNAGVWLVMQTIEHLYGNDSIAVLPLDKETDIVLDLHLLYRKEKPLSPQAVDLYQYLSRCAPAFQP